MEMACFSTEMCGCVYSLQGHLFHELRMEKRMSTRRYLVTTLRSDRRGILRTVVYLRTNNARSELDFDADRMSNYSLLC